MNTNRVLILTYYWPPSGGGGVQRWMYFALYLKKMGMHPTIITVHPNKASYPLLDHSQVEMVKDIPCIYTTTCEPLKLYSFLTTGQKNKGIPYGNLGESRGGVFTKMMAFLRANLFIPDARIGWLPFAKQAANKELKFKKYDWLITTGPPHSTHLAGLSLSKKYNIPWLADFRDPWSEIYFLKQTFRFNFIKKYDQYLETKVLNSATLVTTVGPSMAVLLQNKMISPEKLKVLFNGYDHEMFETLEKKSSKNDRFIISHIGLLGNTQRFDVLIHALKNSALDLSKIVIHLAGSVHQAYLEQLKTELPQIELIHEAFLPRQKALKLMTNSNLLLLCPPMVGETQLIISTKTMEYLATGLPILGIGDVKCDAASLIGQQSNSIFEDPSQVTEISKFIVQCFNNWQIEHKEINPFDPTPYSRYAISKQLYTLLKG